MGASQTPAQIYASVVGAVLAITGTLGFFYESGFDSGAALTSDEVFGVLAINGTHNVVHLVSGLAGLTLAGRAATARLFALVLGAAYVLVFVAGITELGSEEPDAIFDLIPVNGADNVLHLAIGVVGLLAAWASAPRSSAPTARSSRAPSETRRRPPRPPSASPSGGDSASG